MQIPVVLGELREYRKGLEPVLAEHDGPEFKFLGSEAEIAQYRERLDLWISGELADQMNASQEEVAQLEEHSARFLQGVCSRSRRIFHDFGTTVMTTNKCAHCSVSCPNKGCKGCRRRFCAPCWPLHLRDVPQIQWMYADANTLFPELARRDPLRWSSRLCVEEAISEMEKEKTSRPIFFKVFVQGREDASESFESSTAALQWTRDLRQSDEAAHQEDLPTGPGDHVPSVATLGSQVSACSEEASGSGEDLDLFAEEQLRSVVVQGQSQEQKVLAS